MSNFTGGWRGCGERLRGNPGGHPRLESLSHPHTHTPPCGGGGAGTERHPRGVWPGGGEGHLGCPSSLSVSLGVERSVCEAADLKISHCTNCFRWGPAAPRTRPASPGLSLLQEPSRRAPRQKDVPRSSALSPSPFHILCLPSPLPRLLHLSPATSPPPRLTNE